MRWSTGVSRRRGIGFAIANQLAWRGAELFIQSWSAFDAAQPWGSDPEGVDALARELRAHGGKVAYLETDLADPEAPRTLVDSARAKLGHIDILIANHAYSTLGALEELSIENIDAHLTVNVRATMMLIKHFAAQHDGRAGGRVIMMTSGQHLEAMPQELAYVASKGAFFRLRHFPLLIGMLTLPPRHQFASHCRRLRVAHLLTRFEARHCQAGLAVAEHHDDVASFVRGR